MPETVSGSGHRARFEVRADHGFAGAFGLALAILVVAAVVIALASRLLPHPAS